MWPTVEGIRMAPVAIRASTNDEIADLGIDGVVLCSTPLARLVVPEVYKISFTLFGSGRFNGPFAGSRTNCSNDNSEDLRGRTNTHFAPSRGKSVRIRSTMVR